MKKGIAFVLIWGLCMGGTVIPAQDVHAMSNLAKVAKTAWLVLQYTCGMVARVAPLQTKSTEEGGGTELVQAVSEHVPVSGKSSMPDMHPCDFPVFREEIAVLIDPVPVDEFCAELDILMKEEKLLE